MTLVDLAHGTRWTHAEPDAETDLVRMMAQDIGNGKWVGHWSTNRAP